MKKLCALLLALMIFAAVLGGCGSEVLPEEPKNSQPPVESGDTPAIEISEIKEFVPNDGLSGEEKAADFAVRLFKAANEEGKNTLVSPLSVLAALAMTQNGAEGQTLLQMETVLGMEREELNEFFAAYIKNLRSGDKYKLSLANSIWYKDGAMTVKEDFLKTNADYYNAEIKKAAFDQQTLKAINDWVEAKTDGMIKDLLDEIPEGAVMYLINALAFESEWIEQYHEWQIRSDSFTLEDGSKKTVDFMRSVENYYIDDGKARGFIKPLAGNYAFAALLPNEGTSVAEYIASIDGKALLDTLKNPERAVVQATLPAFEAEYSTELSKVLKTMGMVDAFDSDRADLSSLGSGKNGNLFVNRVIHKTYIEVGAAGTKAGAATAVEVYAGSAYNPELLEIKTVTLDRPFVYMLIDLTTNIPFFIGTAMEVGE